MRRVWNADRAQHRAGGVPVSVIVVNYNGAAYLPGCVDSLMADATAPPYDVVIIDNASTDDSRAILARLALRHPDLKLLWSERNLGYAGAVNLALDTTRGDLVAVLNMDVTVTPGWLGSLVAFLEQRPDVAAVNPLITLVDGERTNAAGQDIHVTGLGFNRWLGRPVKELERTPQRVTGIQGGAFLIRRAVLERIDGMDTTGFLYHEDVNLSWLLRLMGFELYCVPESVVRHDYILTMYPGKLYLLERNRWAMLLAYLHRRSLIAIFPLLLLTESLLWGYCLLRGWSFVKAKAASYRGVVQQWPLIKKQQQLAESVRVIPDWKLLRGLHWTYAVDQFVTLGVERGPSRRQRTAEPQRSGIDG
jgi:GT2 family glycosyltransferase